MLNQGNIFPPPRILLGVMKPAVSAYSTLPSLDSAQTPDLHAGTSFSMAGATLDEEDEGDRDFRAASPKKQKRELGWKVGGRRLRRIRRAEELGFCVISRIYTITLITCCA
jgi:hypothetical protein